MPSKHKNVFPKSTGQKGWGGLVVVLVNFPRALFLLPQPVGFPVPAWGWMDGYLDRQICR
jgi:hypothetical protein